MSSQQSAAVEGMYIHFLPSSAPGTSSATSRAVGKFSFSDEADVLLFTAHETTADIVARIAEVDVHIVAHFTSYSK